MAGFPLEIDIALANRQGQLLLIKPKGRGEKFAYPSGWVEYGETLGRAAVRIIEEEVGLEVDHPKSLGHYLLNDLRLASMHVVMGVTLRADDPIVRIRSDYRFKWVAPDTIKDDSTIAWPVRVQFGSDDWGRAWFPTVA
jgi:ADP-ribose pyrophosphatase YjhB (NUDIX family)